MATTIRALGPLLVEVDGVEHIPPRAQRRVLAHLLVAPRRELTVDELIDRLWGERPPATARTSLQVHVSGLRKITPGIVVTTDDGYRIGEAAIDVDDFDRHATEAVELVRAGAWADARVAAGSALTRWRGEPHADIDDHLDTPGAVRRLLDRHLVAVDALATALAGLGRHDLVVATVRAHLPTHPDDERLREHLLLALHRTGRPADALAEYEAFRHHLAATLALEPTDRLRDLARRIRDQDPTLGPTVEPTAPTNLPATATAFIGRADGLAAIAGRLEQDRLVTLVGGPGFGKTRLAVEAARAQRDRWPGGVWHVDLVGIAGSVDLASTIARATHTGEALGDLDAVAESLRTRPCLVVLDNCEPLVEPVRTFATALLERPGQCRVLATSRRPLGVPGEHLLQVEPFTDLDDGLALLTDRARLVDVGFSPTSDERPRLQSLVDDLGGIPLAIELAARWLPSLGADNTATLLERVRGATGLASAFELGAGLLAAEDRELLSRLVVFEAPATLEAIEAVCGDPDDGLGVAGSLARLTESSLVVTTHHPEGLRYRLLPPVRELARERLDERALERLQDRHASTFRSRAVAVAPALSGPDQGPAAARLDEELPDHRAAMTHFERIGDHDRLADLAIALSGYWYARFLGWEGRHWIEAVDRHVLDDGARARIEETAGFLAWSVHDYEAADRHHRAALEIGRRAGDARVTADALFGLGIIHQKRRFEDGGSMLAEAAELYAALPGCERRLGECRLFLGLDEACYRDPAAGAAMLAEAADLLGRSGYRRQVSKAERWLAHAARRLDDEAAARAHAERAEAFARDTHDDVALAGALIERAANEITWGSTASAADHLEEAVGLVPPDDEVDLSQVVFPVALLAHAEGDHDLVGAVLAWIDDVYDRAGWQPLDRAPQVAALRATAEPTTAPSTAELLDRIADLLMAVR